jgi:hypothetical protein
MRIGCFLGGEEFGPHDLVDEARRAEEAGRKEQWHRRPGHARGTQPRLRPRLGRPRVGPGERAARTGGDARIRARQQRTGSPASRRVDCSDSSIPAARRPFASGPLSAPFIAKEQRAKRKLSCSVSRIAVAGNPSNRAVHVLRRVGHGSPSAWPLQRGACSGCCRSRAVSASAARSARKGSIGAR